MAGAPESLTLDNLDTLNALGGNDGRNIYLTTVDDVTKDPAWIKGSTPDASGKINDAVASIIIVNDRGGGNVDAFYFYFWA